MITLHGLLIRRFDIKKLGLPLVILAVSAAVIAGIATNKPSPEADSSELAAVKQIEVIVRPAKREAVSLTASGQGTVAPKREIDLVAQVSGSVVWVAPEIDDGAFFKAGTHIIQIDKRDFEAALSTANARVSAARRALAEEQGRARQAKREWRDLGNNTANELFLREPQLAEARAELSAAESAAKLATVNLERTSIVAPFDGRINKLHVDLGQYIAAGTPVADIYDTSAAEIRIPLTDRQLAILELPLGRSSAKGPEVTITARVAGQQHHWQGFITRTDATVDTHSRMYHAIAEVQHPFGSDAAAVELPLMPGLFVTVEIAGKTLEDVLVLPRQALVRRRLIYVLDDESRVVAEEAEVLKKSDSHVWLRTNVADGAEIVLEKHALLSVGTQVQPLPETAAAKGETNVARGVTQ